MSQNSNIEWCDSTWNPILGCSPAKGSEQGGCKNCYAKRSVYRMAHNPNPKLKAANEGLVVITSQGPTWTGKVRLIKDRLDIPLHWKKPRRIFVNSLSDTFHEALPHRDRARIFNSMRDAPQHTYQILTKRPEVMKQFGEWWCMQHVESIMPSNWWFGVSVEDQKTADERIPLLLQTPAAVRFVSYEPALGPVDFARIPRCMDDNEPSTAEIEVSNPMACHYIRHGVPGIDWAIVGGESGPGARPFNLQWARDIIEQCREAGVACFVKQIGAQPYISTDAWPDGPRVWPHSPQYPRHQDGQERIYTRLSDKKGGKPEEWPADLRVREMPRNISA